MNLGLENKNVFITGGNGGIGAAIVSEYAKEGARVYFSYHTNAQSADSVCEECKTEPPIPMDLLDAESIAGAFAKASSTGGIDVLVNNAVLWRPDSESSKPEFDMFSANVIGQYLLTKLALKSMVEREWGRIVNVSSNIAEDGMAGSSMYSASKSALHGMMASFKWDGGSKGVLINTIMPGLTLTERAKAMIPETVRAQEQSRTPSGQLSRPSDVASAVAFLGSAANTNITGELLRVTGGK